MKYLDFGTPISFGYTAEYLPQKCVTRREWKDTHAAKFTNALNRAIAEGKKLRVPAIDKGYHAGGKQIGRLIISDRPYKQKLVDMPACELKAEGGMCATTTDFISKYFKGDSEKVVWVIRFQFEPCQTKSELSKSSQELEAFASDLNQLENLNSLKPSKSLQPQEQYTQSTFQAHQSGTTCELSTPSPDNLTASLVAAPVKTSVAAENAPDLMAIAPVFGGKCSELLTSAVPTLSDGRTLREHCLADVEKWLPASEWSDIKSKAQSLFRVRSSELHTNESAFSLLPTPTTYPVGLKTGNSTAGRNSLESKLRSLLPTPRANDGTQGYNSGKTGGINLTGQLKVNQLLMPGEAANPQIWGWMMGFPTNWCESVLMPDGLKALADLDGGSDHSPLSKLASPEKILSVAESPSVIMEPLASPPKLSPSPSESSSCSSASLKVLTSNKSDEHYTPENIINAAREVMGEIDLDPMSCKAANGTVRAAKFYDKKADGLKKPWLGKVWLNPAFSLANEAVSKLIQCHLADEVTEAILLIKAAPDTARHQLLAALPFCEWRGRIKFIADGNSQVAPFAVLIFYLGNNFPKFREVFGKFGNIRLGQNQVDELERDRRDLLAKVAELQLQLAKKSDADDRRLDWLEDDICDRTEEAESRLKAFDIDCDIPRFEILSRQRVEWTAKLEVLKSLQKSIDSINLSFFGDRQINRPPRPKIEEIEGWRSEFAANKLVQSGDLVASIKQYSRVRGEWIAICRIRARGGNYSQMGREFYLSAEELFADFMPYESPENLSPYRLGSVRSGKELKRLFRNLHLPNHLMEITAPDGSVWQAFKERDSSRCAIMWRCEVLPNGDSRVPQIPQKNDRPEAAIKLNFSWLT